MDDGSQRRPPLFEYAWSVIRLHNMSYATENNYP